MRKSKSSPFGLKFNQSILSPNNDDSTTASGSGSVSTNDTGDNTLALLQNEQLPLDHNLLSSLVGQLLHCEPKQCVPLPTFRIQELVVLSTEAKLQSIASRSKGNLYLNEFRLIEAVSALFALCLYFSMSTLYIREVSIDVIQLLQYLMLESVVVLQNNTEKKERCLMKCILSTLEKNASIEPEFKLEIFSDSLTYAKNIMRETLDLARIMNKLKELPTKEEKKAGIPHNTECIKPFCVYYMCNFALNHIYLVLHSCETLSLIPGALESVIVSMLTIPADQIQSNSGSKQEERTSKSSVSLGDPSKISKASTPSTSGNSKPPIQKFISAARAEFYRCIHMANELSTFVAHIILEARLLEIAVIAKNRNGRHLINHLVSYQIYRVSPFKTILGMNSAQSGKASHQSIESYDDHNSSRTKSLLNANKVDISDKDYYFFNNSKMSLDVHSIPEEDVADEGNAKPNSSLAPILPISLNSKRVDAVNHLFSALKSSTDAQPLVDKKKLSHYWSIKKNFRDAFLTFDSLFLANEFSSCFVEYQPKSYLIANLADVDILTQPHSFLQKHTPTDVMNFFEASHYQMTAQAQFLPRILNPREEIYWISRYIVEYLHKRAQLGEGICRSLSEEQVFLLRKVQEIQKAKSNAKSKFSTPNSRRKNGAAKAASKGNLATLLSTAKEEASFESRLLRVNMKLKGIDPDQRRDETEENEEPDREKKEEGAEQTSNNNNNKGKPATRRWSFIDESLFADDDSTIISEAPSRVVDSVVWFCPPKNKVKSTMQFIGVELLETNDDPLCHLPSRKESLEYAQAMEEAKQRKQEEEFRFQQYLEDQRQAIIAKYRASKAIALSKMKETAKEEFHARMALAAEWKEEKKRLDLIAKKKAQEEAMAKYEATEREKFRIQQLRDFQAMEDERQKEEYEAQLALSKMFVSKIASVEEAEEIRRQRVEEARMKYLEERRRVIEDRIYAGIREKEEAFRKKQEKAREEADRMQQRVRLGAFQWHNGQYGYYDSVRKESPYYIQYEDASGNAYYYDPINKSNQYHIPKDADIRHHIDVEREEYDAINGEGAYDAFMADRAFKDGVNRDGGYYDDHGHWIEAHGHYDENYEWVEHDGYFDENGKYIQYAKVQGDLSFMV